MLSPDDVVADVRFEALAPTRAHPWLRSQVERHVTLGHELFEIAAREVDRDEVEALPASCALEVAQLVATTVVVVKAVDPDHLDPVLEQGLGEMRPDEPRAAGDERAPHGCGSRVG